MKRIETCVRDYIHVCDWATAHKTALEMLFSGIENKGIKLVPEATFRYLENYLKMDKITNTSI